jgi:hypothetical protein
MAKKKQQQMTTFSVPKPTYTVVLKTVPAQTPGGGLGIGVENARYHLDQLFQALNKEGWTTSWSPATVDEATRSRLQRDVDEFHRHLRAFFWELVAEFDMLLVTVNHFEGLGIAEERVSWDEVARQAHAQGKWSTRIDTLCRAYCSAWFTEVRAYRNFAHRAPLLVICDVGDGQLNALKLLPAIQGQAFTDLRDQLREYLRKMEQLLKGQA